MFTMFTMLAAHSHLFTLRYILPYWKRWRWERFCYLDGLYFLLAMLSALVYSLLFFVKKKEGNMWYCYVRNVSFSIFQCEKWVITSALTCFSSLLLPPSYCFQCTKKNSHVSKSQWFHLHTFCVYIKRTARVVEQISQRRLNLFVSDERLLTKTRVISGESQVLA